MHLHSFYPLQSITREAKTIIRMIAKFAKNFTHPCNCVVMMMMLMMVMMMIMIMIMMMVLAAVVVMMTMIIMTIIVVVIIVISIILFFLRWYFDSFHSVYFVTSVA